MANTEVIKEFDVLIIGAGPGGCSCALALKDTGLKVAIIDKSSFPRDKVCGELMHRKALRTLTRIDPSFEAAFKSFEKTSILKYTRVHYKNKSILFEWHNESYTCPRMDLDNFLLNWVKDHSTTEVFTLTTPDKITIDDNEVSVTIKNTTTVFKGKVIIGADGAQSTVARQLTEKSIDRKHYLGAVRAYYSDVQGVKDDVSEVFFNTKFQLNYFWVFPIKGNQANVGFGMLSSHISEKKVNLKDTFYQYLKESPELTEKFRNAQAVSPLEGFGVPLGSNVGVTSGQRFMLIGDAASLSNPISGTGMGNAVLSGKLAAEQVERCFKSNDFSQTSMKQYDVAIQKAIIDELMSSFKAQRILGRMPFLLDIVFWLSKYKRVKTMIQKIV